MMLSRKIEFQQALIDSFKKNVDNVAIVVDN